MFAGIPRLVSMAKLPVSHRHLCDVGADLVELRLASQDQLCHLLFGTPLPRYRHLVRPGGAGSGNEMRNLQVPTD
jgi:hypothetical protein